MRSLRAAHSLTGMPANSERIDEIMPRRNEIPADAVGEGLAYSTARKAISVNSHAPLRTAAVTTFVEVRTRL